jgi:two-component system, cell cycle sensor histidine kinase and response regulator CckA
MNTPIHILVVEDDPAHSELIERSFGSSSERFRVSVARNLAAALSFLRETAPDLIIADWRLPDGDGLDLVRGSDMRAEIPVVLMTSHGNERVAVDAIQSGVLDYVVKTVESLSDMPHTAERALREWRNRMERDRMQAALRESEKKYRFLAENVVDVIWTMDLQMRLTFMSPSEEKMYGWDHEERTTLQPQDYLPPQSLALARKTLADQLAMQGGPEDEGVTLEMEQYRKDGTTFWAEVKARLLRDEQGAPTGIIGSTRDITERKRFEQALVQEKAFSDMVIDSLPGVFYICDEQGMLVRWNDNDKVVAGYSREELSQMNVIKLFERDGELVAAYLREVFETGRASVEATIMTGSGRAIPFYLTGFRMVADDKRYVVGVGIDISERKSLEQQLRHAQKMESIGQLAGGIAHDFNNILAAIVGYGSILQMKMRNDDPSMEYVNEILTSAERAANLTQSLLAFGRKQVINPRDIDLNESISKIEKLLTRIIGEDIMLTTALSTEMLIVYADVTQIEQVLMNLATNARDAMPTGGRLMIETGRVMLDDVYIRTKGYGTPGSYAVLNISDTGKGMDEQTQKKIFEPFFTTKELGRGTGLGLAIVYGIVKQNNGYINVYSEPGKGTTFKIYFPLVSSRAGDIWYPGVQQPLRVGTETILFAEDNETIRQLNKDVLQEFGYTVIEAADGEEALQKFREHRDRISLFILDVIMPKKNGREVFEEARRSNPNVKAIFTSGYPADLIQKEGVLEKGQHFLSKPSSPQALLRKVREVLDQ